MKRIEYILLCSLLVLWTACEKDTLPMNFSGIEDGRGYGDLSNGGYTFG